MRLFRKPLPPLDPELASLERVYRVPPLSKESVRAIRLIAPQYHLRADAASREFWETDQNGSCWGEYRALEPVLRTVPVPGRILEIGPGMGRSAVFFTKKLGWRESEIHLYEGEGKRTRYTSMGPRFENSFCGTFSALDEMLEYNGVHNAHIKDAAHYKHRLDGLPGPYDLIYSFYSIGFHWGIEHFLDEITGLMHDRSIGMFTVPEAFEPFPELERLNYRVLRWKPVWPKDMHHHMLLISPGELPDLSAAGDPGVRDEDPAGSSPDPSEETPS